MFVVSEMFYCIFIALNISNKQWLTFTSMYLAYKDFTVQRLDLEPLVLQPSANVTKDLEVRGKLYSNVQKKFK